MVTVWDTAMDKMDCALREASTQDAINESVMQGALTYVALLCVSHCSLQHHKYHTDIKLLKGFELSVGQNSVCVQVVAQDKVC